jgi:ABC-type antimicrobial peptide transport system permease subunit
VSLGLRAGRTFDTDDRAGGNPVAIVNAAFTRMIGVSDRDILGRCIPWRVDRCVEIVGVVEDTRFFDAIEEPQPAIYTAIAQEQRDQATAQALILARTAGTTSQIAATIRHELQLLAPELRYVDVQSMADLLRPTLQPWRIATVIFTLFGAVAFLLAAVGLYSVIAYLVEARSAEMGIRMALGAGQARIAQMVVAEGIRLAGYGVVLGLGLAVWSSQLLKNRFFGVQPIDPPTYVSVIILMVSIAVAASLISALRATKIDPNVALKSD